MKYLYEIRVRIDFSPKSWDTFTYLVKAERIMDIETAVITRALRDHGAAGLTGRDVHITNINRSDAILISECDEQ